ncbi:MAG: DHH family phosphoesterase [Clostridia bacterium]|nr:DHH family phosphoesterase [Clostridia bacterium]
MKKVWGVGKIFLILLILLIADIAVIAFGGEYALYISGGIALIGAVVAIVSLVGLHTNIGKIISGVSKGISTAQSKALTELKLPVLISTVYGEIVWYNPQFENDVDEASQMVGKDIIEVFGREFKDNIESRGEAELALANKIFSVTDSDIEAGAMPLRIYYLFDITELRKIAHEYHETRPVVALVAIDNLDEITKNARDSEIASFRGAVQRKIEKWSSKINGVCRKLSGDRYMLVLEERSYKKLSDEGFTVLENVRELKFNDSSATLSIGVGQGGGSMAECEEMAKQALDMALGRGGDQTVVKMPNNEYKFYGGVSGALEKHNKVRARIIASTLKSLIMSSSNVILMGHRFADLDSLGSCIAMASAVSSLGRQSYIVMDKGKTMAGSLMDRADSLGVHCNILSGSEVMPVIDKETLLIVCDVHRPSFLDSPEVYDHCQNVVVIDHHRKSVDFINDAVIFYHETAVSSTCEMVAEMLQYMCPKGVGQFEAEALLSGIMLDSRNFVLNTGVRTFEASAFLRNRGADPVTVKKLFAGSMETYKLRAEIVSSAELYDDDCAIAINDTVNENTRLASAQAADEMLGISGVLGSFVVCRYGSEFNISARSLGSMNVQVIMEKLGGGGHRTMAACQLRVDSFEDAVEQLKNAIDEYKKELRK